MSSAKRDADVARIALEILGDDGTKHGQSRLIRTALGLAWNAGFSHADQLRRLDDALKNED